VSNHRILQSNGVHQPPWVQIFGSHLRSYKGNGVANEHEKTNYLEFPARDLESTKLFFTSVFGWSFVDYGPEYTAFSNAGIDGGFFKSDLTVSTKTGSALIVFYSEELEETQSKIEHSGGSIIKAIFTFPGGHRFHFSDPNGNEYGVWSDT